MLQTASNYRLLLVDDDPVMLALLRDFLAERYQVETAIDGPSALERLSQAQFDLVISDIAMPAMQGYELVSHIRKTYPETKTALITACAPEEYMDKIRDYDIGCIISKTVPFDLEEMAATIDRYLSREIFGLKRYMTSKAVINTQTVSTPGDISRLRQELTDILMQTDRDEDRRMSIRLMLDEAISNAVYHAHQLPKGHDFDFEGKRGVLVEFGRDEEQIGVAVSDASGRLSRKDVLSSMAACHETTLESLLRESGRGFFLMHNVVDRMIINVERGVKTEIVLIIFTQKKERGHRPLIIHEIDPIR